MATEAGMEANAEAARERRAESEHEIHNYAANMDAHDPRGTAWAVLETSCRRRPSSWTSKRKVVADRSCVAA